MRIGLCNSKAILFVFILIMLCSALILPTSIVQASSSPDLTVTSVSYYPSSATVGQSISVTFTVKNQGMAASGSFNNRISLATTQWGTTYSLGNPSMDSLAAGASQTQTVTTNPISSSVSCPGSYYVTVFADGFQQISESNENNNIGSSTPSMITVSCSTPQTGSISVNSNVSGAGFSLSGPSGFSGTTSWNTGNAGPGSYTVSWFSMSGYTTPPAETQVLSPGGSISFYGNYQQSTPQTGSISINSNVSGAGFSLSGPSGFSGTTSWNTGDAGPGSYTVSWFSVSGYTRPPAETQVLPPGGSISFYGNYQQSTPQTPSPAPTPTPTPTPPTSPNPPAISQGQTVYKQISLGPYTAGNKYYLRIYNVDDVAKATVNNTQVKTVNYYQDSGWFDITQYVREGDNSIELTVENSSVGWTYGFALRQNDSTIWEDSCGNVGVAGCKSNDQTSGLVYHCVLTLITASIPTPTPSPTPSPIQYILAISTNGQGSTNPSAGTHFYSQGSQVTVTASPASDWKFSYWGGDASGTSTSTSVVMNSNRSLIAYFAPSPTQYQPYSVGFDIRNMLGFSDGVITADDVLAFIKARIPNSPMIGEPDIGKSLINAGVNNGVNPAFLIATARLEGVFGTDGWAASHPSCHNTMGWGIPSSNTTPNLINCAGSWGEMMNRVAYYIAYGSNYYGAGRYTVEEIRSKYAAKPNSQSIANIMNDLYEFAKNRAAPQETNQQIQTPPQQAPQSVSETIQQILDIVRRFFRP